MSPLNTIRIVAADHPIDSVVVLKSSKAEVVRTFDVALKSGQNKFIISKLPNTIDTQSVRISGLDPAAPKNSTYLSDVVCSVSDPDGDSALEEATYALEIQKALLEQEKQVLHAQGGILVKYANSLTGEHASPEVMNEFLSEFREQGKENVHAIANLDAKIRQIDRQIKDKKKKSSSKQGSANTELTAMITAENDTDLNLKLTYIVSGTNWSPTYELHAVTDESGQPSRTVSLHYRACITQSTGEDWTDADLTLSTVATDTIIKRVPTLDPIKIRVSSVYTGGTIGSGLFGGSNQSQSQSQFRPSGFGAFGASNTNNNTSGTWFGSTVPSASSFGNNAAPFGGSAFGNTAPSGSWFGNAAPSGSGLFGGSAPSSTGLFGASAYPAATGPSPFGTAVPAASGSSSFGTSSLGATAATPGASLFGAATAATRSQLFGTTTTAPARSSGPAPAVVGRPPHTSPDHGVVVLPDDDSDDEHTDGELSINQKPTKLVTQTPMALTYTVRGKSSIPSDGKEHIVAIAVLSFEMDVEYVSVPRVDPRVYLQCQVTNKSDYRLLSGPVSIILDDSYVSKNTISDINRDQLFRFTLGDDPSVSIFYCRASETTKEGAGTFADIINTTTFTTSIHVRNKHSFPIEKLILKDAIPVSDDKRVRVVLKKPKELIEAKDWEPVKIKLEKEQSMLGGGMKEDDGEGDDERGVGLTGAWQREKDGLYEYRWRIGADAQVKLETVFEMKASADLNCTFCKHSFLFGKKA